MSDKFLNTYKSAMSILKQDIISTIIKGTSTGTFKIPLDERNKLIRVLDASIDTKSSELYNVINNAAKLESTTLKPKKSGGKSGKNK